MGQVTILELKLYAFNIFNARLRLFDLSEGNFAK